MKIGTLQRIVGGDGIGRLWLVDSENGDAFSVTGKELREAGVVHPTVGDAFEFLATRDGRATQLRKVVA
jgi:hypothetical protein